MITIPFNYAKVNAIDRKIMLNWIFDHQGRVDRQPATINGYLGNITAIHLSEEDALAFKLKFGI